MAAERKNSIPEPLSKSERHHFSFYEKQPRGYKRSKERTYFDCGDIAVSAGQHAIESDAIESGCEHPRRDSILHPNAPPVPSSSNIGYGGNRTMNRKSVSPGRKGSCHYENETKLLGSKYDDGDKRSPEDLIKEQKLYNRERKKDNY